MKLIAIQTRRRVIKNKTFEIKKGLEYNSNTKLVKSFPTTCFMKKPQGPKERYTQKELELMVNLYVKHTDPSNNSDNRYVIIAEFRQQYDTHTNASLELLVNQMKNVDKLYNADGMSCVTRQLKNILYTLYPERFICNGPTLVENFDDEVEAGVPVEQVAQFFGNLPRHLL
jgi:hypothetical protein